MPRPLPSNPTQENSDFKASVLAATDIVQTIGSSVVLKKRGKDYVGLCPFHQEKSPSFHVSPAKQMFYCYGCKAGGDVISFVMKRDRVEFFDALSTLARAAGIAPPARGSRGLPGSDRQKLLDAHSAATAFFEKCLASEIGLPARNYLSSRGFTEESIRRFHIGMAPDSWDGLLRGDIARKFTPPVLAMAGLVKSREGGSGYYDTFRNRLIFPIRNESGQTIAFGGRVLPGSNDPAKYLNSPETPLFSKSRALFGLDLARQKIVEKRTAAIVEGYTDVVMAHQFGVTNVVSVLGTAMTAPHVSVLRRFADKIVLLFDADTAGDLAADRVVELFLTQPIEIAVASMPQGVDPDEFLLHQGPEAFEKTLSDANDVLAYKWRQLARQYAVEQGDLTGQQKAVQQYLELLASARGAGPVDALRWGSALARVSRLTDIPIDDLNRRFKAQRPRGPIKSRRDEPSAAQAADDGQTPALPDGPPPPQGPRTASDRAERWILGILLLEPARWQHVQALVGIDEFSDPLCRRLAEIYWSHQQDEGEPVLGELLATLNSPQLVELAVGLVDEIEAIAASGSESSPPASAQKTPAAGPKPSAAPTILESTLDQALDFLARQRQQKEQQKHMARLRRTNDNDNSMGAQADRAAPEIPAETVSADPSANEDLFARFVKGNPSTNLHRLGPVRRSRP